MEPSSVSGTLAHVNALSILEIVMGIAKVSALLRRVPSFCGNNRCMITNK